MKKPRVKLADPNYMSTEMPQFNDAKHAINKPCRTAIAQTNDGQVFRDVVGIIVAVDSRPVKGGKDAVYVGIKCEQSEFMLYAEFKNVEVLNMVKS